MLTGEMAKYRIDDRVREAEAFRASKVTRAGRRDNGRSRARRVSWHALTAMLWPVKH